MAYVGKAPLTGAYQVLDNIASGFNASATAFNLTVGGTAVLPGNEASCIISISGVVQDPSAFVQYQVLKLHFHRRQQQQILFLELCSVTHLTLVHRQIRSVTSGSLSSTFFVKNSSNME